MEKATGKSGFLLYHDQRAFFCLLNDAEAKALILAVFDYETMRTEPGSISPAADMAFVAIRQTLDRNRVKHDAIVDRRREYGRLGGLAKASLSKQELAKPSKASYTDTVTDSVTVTDTVTDRLEGIPSAGVPEKDLFKTRIGAIFSRRASTAWTPKEIKALHALTITEDDMKLIEGFYGEPRASWQEPAPYLWKKDMLTLLNNWTSAIDRARGYVRPAKAKNAEHSSTIWLDESENRRIPTF